MATSNWLLAEGNEVFLSDEHGSGNAVKSGYSPLDLATGNVVGNTIGEITLTGTSAGSYVASNAVQSGQFIKAEDSRKWTISGTYGTDTIRLGDGGGSISSGNGQDTLYGGSGTDTFEIKMDAKLSGNNFIYSYTYGQDNIVTIGNGVDDLVFGKDGRITAKGDTGNGIFLATNSSNIGKVTVSEGVSDPKTNVWFATSDSGVNINAGDAKENIRIVGGAGKDTLIGGLGKDTIVAGDSDLVWGGFGATADLIDLGKSTGNNSVGFAAGSGVDKVEGFKNGFVTGNDSIYLFENAITDVGAVLKADSGKGNITVSLGNDKTVFNGVTVTTNAAQFFVKGADGVEKKVWLGATGAEQTFVANGAGNDADYYIGSGKGNAAISFDGSADGVVIDMAHTGQFVDNRVYQNIGNVVGGEGSDTIIGAVDMANTLIGGDGDDHIWGKGSKSDTLFGGDGQDTFYFGAGDGKDFLGDYGDGVAGGFFGNDVVNLHSLTGLDGARAGFNAAGNAYIKLVETGDILTFTQSDDDASDGFKVTVSDAAGTKTNVWLMGENGTFEASAGNEAGIYIGNGNNALSFADAHFTDTALNIDLRDSSKYIGISHLTGGNTSSTLIGSAGAASIITGQDGDDSLFGGGKFNDTLTGGTGADMFFFDATDGNDIVADYKQAEGDSVKFWQSNTGVGVKKDASGNVVLSIGSDSLTLAGTGVTGSDVSIVDAEMFDGTKAKVVVGKDGKNNTLTFADDVTGYYGGNKVDTLNVTGMDNAAIWLDNREATFYTGIENIDASTATGDMILAGAADMDNKISGGKGTSSLWGGAGKGNDTLIGGTGTNIFYYGMDEGNDIIESGDAMDKVMVYSPNFTVKSTELKSGNLIITTQNDNTLTVKGWGADKLNTFEMADGTQWGYDQESKSLKEKK